MDKNDLISTWRIAHSTNPENIYNKINIKKTIKMNHSTAISKVLSGVKRKILVYALSCLIVVGLTIYAFIWLKLKLSMYSILPLAFSGLFLFVKTVLEIRNLVLVRKTTDNLSLKDSLLSFRKELSCMSRIDFISYLFNFYFMAILIIYIAVKDSANGNNLFWGNQIMPFVMIPVLLLLALPWFIKYQFNQEYKKTFSNLNDSLNFLKDETS
jgi:hypothetical protein